MVTLEQARDYLRLDGTDNDEIIKGLLNAAPGYIQVATGHDPRHISDPLADTAIKLLLLLWYKPEQSEIERLQRALDSILKALSAKWAAFYRPHR